MVPLVVTQLTVKFIITVLELGKCSVCISLLSVFQEFGLWLIRELLNWKIKRFNFWLMRLTFIAFWFCSIKCSLKRKTYFSPNWIKQWSKINYLIWYNWLIYSTAWDLSASWAIFCTPRVGTRSSFDCMLVPFSVRLRQPPLIWRWFWMETFVKEN